MLLLDANPSITISSTFVIQIIAWAGGSLITLIGLFYWVVSTLHKQGMHVLTELAVDVKQIEVDLKPLVIQIALHTEQIKEIREDLVETNKWVSLHTGQIQFLERAVKAAS
jgi:hypothetical protein